MPEEDEDVQEVQGQATGDHKTEWWAITNGGSRK